jgi:hypothetical protein
MEEEMKEKFKMPEDIVQSLPQDETNGHMKADEVNTDDKTNSEEKT